MGPKIEDTLPENARIWVYQSNRKLKTEEVLDLQVHLGDFVSRWTSHKIGVAGSGHLLYNRFVVFMADEEAVKLGGCSIDSSVRFLKETQRRIQTDFFDRLSIAYRKGNEVESCTPPEFQKLVEAGVIQDETLVFNNLIQTKKELFTHWEIPYRDSWHKNLAVSHTPFSSLL